MIIDSISTSSRSAARLRTTCGSNDKQLLCYFMTWTRGVFCQSFLVFFLLLLLLLLLLLFLLFGLALTCIELVQVPPVLRIFWCRPPYGREHNWRCTCRCYRPLGRDCLRRYCLNRRCRDNLGCIVIAIAQRRVNALLQPFGKIHHGLVVIVSMQMH